jgi:hypothetical protein
MNISFLKTIYQLGQFILFSVVFTLQPPRQCLGPKQTHFTSCAGLAVHMVGEFSGDPKRRRVCAALYSILFAFNFLDFLSGRK